MTSFRPVILTILLMLSVPASVCLVLHPAHSANDTAGSTGKTSQTRSAQPQQPQPTPKQSKESSAKTKTSTLQDFIPSETIAADQAVPFPVDM